MFLLGLLAALLGNCAIGLGQTLQKHAINRIAALSYLPSARRRRPIPSNADPAISLATRARNRTWLLGLLLAYLGEACGNWVALSFVSAAVVTPLGIVSVIVNAVLAHKYLGEKITRRQRIGYGVVACGVLIILLAAPKGGQLTKDPTRPPVPSQILDECCRTRSFFLGLATLVSSVLMLIYVLRSTRYSKKWRDFLGKDYNLYLHVAICSLFGAVTVTCGKVLSVLARVRAMSATSSGAHVAVANATTGAAGEVTSSTGVATPVLAMILVIGMSVMGLELFRQRALTHYPVSRFQPMLFATFNGCAVMSNVLLFHEIPTISGLIQFFAIFGVGMTVILMGLRTAQQSDGSTSLAPAGSFNAHASPNRLRWASD
ncbi:uncharacterized protein SPPG_07299 [Spizellomyces punctatus DAOM BR117]|uniref:EamA domain-containing protein n=1 Tax=Spizellomyces punctatus (strain DAOM BR117) TaxID=645134 RepID=A0A0L0H811_SPIPD|nr:uncharacterized protein SPPG_07299 [Spizellomyces punctatus DAOM BR117]KNC97372.1 hypothetical protein SPPG_07299 [Spizellomyces punctatus DAOM BR117]|eukprot:XP_016605412.1 hypothetical protein SPPG_07299 [Spizellomyces punctatus DAOM BR117]